MTVNPHPVTGTYCYYSGDKRISNTKEDAKYWIVTFANGKYINTYGRVKDILIEYPPTGTDRDAHMEEYGHHINMYIKKHPTNPTRELNFFK